MFVDSLPGALPKGLPPGRLMTGSTPGPWVSDEPVVAPGRLWARYQARVIGFEGSSVFVSVASPPLTAEHAAHVALEHILTGASDLNDGTFPFPDCAEALRGEWSFWWDRGRAAVGPRVDRAGQPPGSTRRSTRRSTD